MLVGMLLTSCMVKYKLILIYSVEKGMWSVAVFNPFVLLELNCTSFSPAFLYVLLSASGGRHYEVTLNDGAKGLTEQAK